MARADLAAEIVNRILDKREGLDNVPSIIIAAVVKRAIAELDELEGENQTKKKGGYQFRLPSAAYHERKT